MNYTICYTSKAMEGLNEASVELIFLSTQENNVAKNITGILLYSLGNFFQVLEGDEKTVKELYDEYIKVDPRHKDVFEIISKNAPAVFSEYNSLFKIIQSSEELINLQEYLSRHNISSTSDKFKRLLNTFII